MSTRRIRLDVAYDGTDFSGWARQPGLRTVCGSLETELAKVLREPVTLTVAGRTDAGVHARAQVCHLDVDPAWLDQRSLRGRPEALVRRLARLLPDDIAVMDARWVPEEFDARFSALRRHYEYRLTTAPWGADPVRARDTAAWQRTADLDLVRLASHQLLGLHDFAAFCRPREGATTVRTLLSYRWERGADGTVVGRVEADAFCHSMVRALVGAVVPVGEGRRPTSWPRAVLDAGRRDPGVQVMPAHGLCLEEIVYPEGEEALRARDLEARATRAHDPAEGP